MNLMTRYLRFAPRPRQTNAVDISIGPEADPVMVESAAVTRLGNLVQDGSITNAQCSFFGPEEAVAYAQALLVEVLRQL